VPLLAPSPLPTINAHRIRPRAGNLLLRQWCRALGGHDDVVAYDVDSLTEPPSPPVLLCLRCHERRPVR
jgi:hypothetical protein